MTKARDWHSHCWLCGLRNPGHAGFVWIAWHNLVVCPECNRFLVESRMLKDYSKSTRGRLIKTSEFKRKLMPYKILKGG